MSIRLGDNKWDEGEVELKSEDLNDTLNNMNSKGGELVEVTSAITAAEGKVYIVQDENAEIDLPETLPIGASFTVINKGIAAKIQITESDHKITFGSNFSDNRIDFIESNFSEIRLRYIGDVTLVFDLIQTLTEATNGVSSVSFNNDNKYVAYGDQDGNVYVHNVSDWSLETELTESSGSVRSVSFSNDDSYIAYGSVDKNMYIGEQGNFSFWQISNLTGDVELE